MQRIPLALARAGMVLAKDVVRPSAPTGPPICGKGTALTDALIERLARLEATAVTVEGHPVAVEGDPTPEEELARFDHRFSRVDGDPMMQRIKELLRARLVRALAR